MEDSVHPVHPAPTTTTWTPRFAGLFAAVALLGGLVVFLGSTGSISLLGVSPFISPNLVPTVIYAGLVAVCLTGLWSTGKRLLEAGLLLQIGAAACLIVANLLNIQALYAHAAPNTALLSALGVSFSLLNLASLVCLSYGLAHWQASDRLWIVVQLLLAAALGTAILVAHRGIFEQTDVTPIEVACTAAAAMVLLARPACWRAHSLLTFCLGIGGLGPLAFAIFFLQPNPLLSFDDLLHLYFALASGAPLLSLLGVLLLGQTERIAPGKS